MNTKKNYSPHLHDPSIPQTAEVNRDTVISRLGCLCRTLLRPPHADDALRCWRDLYVFFFMHIERRHSGRRNSERRHSGARNNGRRHSGHRNSERRHARRHSWRRHNERRHSARRHRHLALRVIREMLIETCVPWSTDMRWYRKVISGDMLLHTPARASG